MQLATTGKLINKIDTKYIMKRTQNTAYLTQGENQLQEYSRLQLDSLTKKYNGATDNAVGYQYHLR